MDSIADHEDELQIPCACCGQSTSRILVPFMCAECEDLGHRMQRPKEDSKDERAIRVKYDLSEVIIISRRFYPHAEEVTLALSGYHMEALCVPAKAIRLIGRGLWIESEPSTGGERQAIIRWRAWHPMTHGYLEVRWDPR